MAISARSRRGTSPSFWRNHNALQTMMAEACMPSSHRKAVAGRPTVVAPPITAPVWFPTVAQIERYQSRGIGAVLLGHAS